MSNQETKNSGDVCPLCGGTEWILKEVNGVEVAEPCKCRKMAIMRRKKRFADIPVAFDGIALQSFSLTVYKTKEGKEKAYIACKIIKEYLNMFDEAKRNGMGLYIFSGAKGSGKTRMAVSIANELMEKHDSLVKFATGMNILEEIKKSYDDKSYDSESKLISELIRADVLVLDDFGTEKVTEWVQNKFYWIINQRYIYKKPIIFTSNESLETLPYDERITSRIKEMCYQIDFPEEYVRDYIAEENMKTIIKQALNKKV